MQYDYEEICRVLLAGNIELLLAYQGHSYWLTVRKTVCFGDSEGIVGLVFATVEELLNASLLDGKTLQELWPDIEVDSLENGWNKTTDCHTSLRTGSQ